MTTHQQVRHLIESADVSRYLAAAAERDGYRNVAEAFRAWANRDERRAGEILARPLVPGPQWEVAL